MIVNLIDYLKARLSAVRNFCYGGIIAIIIGSLILVDTHHAHTWAEKHIPGFWALFGLFSTVVLIFVAGWLGRSGIQTREDYYDR
jgi:4-hydroxybenzoate polyprenyltransferase